MNSIDEIIERYDILRGQAIRLRFGACCALTREYQDPQALRILIDEYFYISHYPQRPQIQYL